VAQSGSALALGARGRRFESARPDSFGTVRGSRNTGPAWTFCPFLRPGTLGVGAPQPRAQLFFRAPADHSRGARLGSPGRRSLEPAARDLEGEEGRCRGLPEGGWPGDCVLPQKEPPGS
jgi:hypothetical protein